MANPFDSLQDGMLAIVFNTMGYTATWQPSDGSPVQTGEVLLNRPTAKYELQVEYDVVRTRIEYKPDCFHGLFEKAQQNPLGEKLTINGINYVTLPKPERKYDGKTIIIYLQEE
jgi:hypothetical protein